MLLKNKAPSLKSQINIENISTNSFHNPENNNKPNFSSRNLKEEALDHSLHLEKFNSKIDLKNDLDFHNIYLNANQDLVNADYSNSINVLQNPQTFAIIDINIELLSDDKKLVEPLKDPNEINAPFNSNEDITFNNRKRKSECSLDEFQSTEADNNEIEKINKAKRTKNIPKKNTKKTNIVMPKSLDIGVYVECDACHKTRYLKDVYDPSVIPSYWTCEMEKNNTLNCEIVQENFEESDDYFIYNHYTLGSVVWARAPGFCWWPGIIDDDPDLQMFYWCFDNSSDVSHYHVTFLDDDVSRSWVTNRDIKVFRGKSEMNSMKFIKSKKDYSKTIAKAADKAEECLKLSLQECLDKYSFAVRYTGKPNVWTKEKSKRKSKASLRNTDSDDSIAESEKQSISCKKTTIKKRLPLKKGSQLDELNNDLSILEVQSEVLLATNQCTKHDLIVKNTTKENRNKTPIKNRKKVKNSEIVEE